MDLAKKRAFTLTEVIVVMSIIAVLATLVLGAIVVAKKNAKNNQRTTVAQTLETALDGYADNNKGLYYYDTSFDDSNGFVKTVNDFVAGNVYLKEVPEGLIKSGSSATTENNKNFFFRSYNNNVAPTGSGADHYVLAVCADGGNTSGSDLGISGSIKTATKDDVTNCSNNVIYFVRK